MFVLILLCLFICVCVYGIRKRVRVKPSPPVYPGALPVIGHLYKLFGDNQYLYRLMVSVADKSNQKEGVIVVKIGLADYYVITDPDDFNTAANECLTKHYVFRFPESWLGNGLISGTDTSIWRRHRKLISPTFGLRVVNEFMNTFNSASKKIVKDMAVELGRGPFDHSVYMDQLSMGSIYQTVFGVNASEIENVDTKCYIDAVKEFFHLNTKRIQQWWLHTDFMYNLTKQKKELDDLANYLNSVSTSELKKKISSTNKHDENKNKSLLDILLELGDKGELTDKEICGEMNTFIAAGYETSGSTLMYTLMLLGSYKNVQNKVYDELQSVFGDSLRDVDKQDLSKLNYLEAVLKESLRLLTITPIMARHVDKDVQLKNYTMPAGSNCLLFVCGLHRHPIWGDDVDQFRPERWLENPISDKAFAGFGVGKRLCLGKAYSLMLMKTALAHMLRQYRVTSDITQLVLKVEPLLKPVSGHNITLELRTASP